MKAQGSVAIVAIVVVLVVLIGIGIYFVNSPPQGYAFFERTTVIEDNEPDVIIYNNTETRTVVEDNPDSVTIINNPPSSSSSSTSTSTSTSNTTA